MTLPRFAERDDRGNALFRVRVEGCLDCESRWSHEHLYTIADHEILTAAVLLEMRKRDPGAFEHARIDLEKQNPGVYSTTAMAVWALEAERDEDEQRGMDDRGRRVA